MLDEQESPMHFEITGSKCDVALNITVEFWKFDLFLPGQY